jgi:hypothetical protein
VRRSEAIAAQVAGLGPLGSVEAVFETAAEFFTVMAILWMFCIDCEWVIFLFYICVDNRTSVNLWWC